MSNPIIDCKKLRISYSFSEYRYSSFKEYLLQVAGRKHKRHYIHALQDVDLQITAGESVALLGHNGSGKSTLLKVLAGIITPKCERLTVSGRVAPMIELGTGFDGELSGRENIRLSCALMGLTKSETDARIEDIINFSEIREFIDMPLKNYSSGMQARLGFACATAVDPEILLVDEVLSVGDQNFATKCLRRIDQMRENGCTIILVSHDVNTSRVFCRRGIVLENGIKRFDGDIDSAISAHNAIMHERYLLSLSEEERNEQNRKAKLAQDAQERAAGGGDPIPLVDVATLFIQSNQIVELIDLAKPFAIEFGLTISNSNYFRDKVSIGIGLNTLTGLRLGGANNLEKHTEISATSVGGLRKLRVRFEFGEGVPELCAGTYALIFGVHDSDLTRTIYCQHLTNLSANNSKYGLNGDNDILKLSSFVTSIIMEENEKQLT